MTTGFIGFIGVVLSGSVSNDLMWLIPPFIEHNSDNSGGKAFVWFGLVYNMFLCLGKWLNELQKIKAYFAK